MNRVKKLVLVLLLSLMSFPLWAQEKTDTINLFRFVAEKDMFFTPWNGNGQELDRLLAAIGQHRTAIDSGRMYLYVTSYGTSAHARKSASELAKIRRNRVKSELILRGKVKENHFVTDRTFSETYRTKAGELRDIVVVMLPAPVKKVAGIAGAEAAAKVEAYNRETGGEAEAEKARQAEARRVAAEKAEQERIAREKELARQKRLTEEKAAKERAEQEQKATRQPAQTGQTEENLLRDMPRWYAGIQGGVPFAVSAFSSFGADKTRAGWSAGVYGGYRFNSALSLEAQAAWGQMNLSARSCCPDYWLGSDGNRYEAAVAGMEGWNYADLKSRVAIQRYGVQLNVNILGFFNSTKYSRWTLELSPQLSAMGTKAAFRTIVDNTEVVKEAMRWHLGAGGNLQAGYALTDHLHIGIYTGVIYLTGKPLDGTPKHLHEANYVWESGLRIGWSFGNRKEIRK